MFISLFDLIFVISAIIFNTSISGLYIFQSKKREDIVRKLGYIVVILTIPIAIVMIDYIIIGTAINLIIVFIIVLIYIAIEFFLDFVFKIEFRKKPVIHALYNILFYAALFSLIIIGFSINSVVGYLISITFWILLICLVYLLIQMRKQKKEFQLKKE